MKLTYKYIFSIPLCTLVNQYLASLARKFPATKFLKSISTTCIPNWPDSNLPTIFIYHKGNMVKQIIGPLEFRGMKLSEAGNTCLIAKCHKKNVQGNNCAVYFVM